MAADGRPVSADAMEGNASRAEYVYRMIRDDIRSGRLLPGERVRETDLAARLAVSRTPIREAIRRLVENGLLSHAAGGLAVTVLDDTQMKELYEVRAVLEGAAAAFAAQHASPDDVARMKALALRCRDAASAAEAAAANEELHRVLHGASHNRYLAMLQGRFSEWLALLPGTTYAAEGRPASAWLEHSRIIDAVEARDAEAARSAAVEHIANAYRLRLAARGA